MPYLCRACGYSGCWTAKCRECRASGSMIPASLAPQPVESPPSIPLVPWPAVDQVLGDLPPGAVVLLSGDPGVGKSTFALQWLAKRSRGVYLANEESAEMIQARQARLGLAGVEVAAMGQWRSLDLASRLRAESIVVDSLQGLGGQSIVTLIERMQTVMAHARLSGATVLVIAHRTKADKIAGPKSVEHMVDVVASLDHVAGLVVLSSSKNRFSPISRSASFGMEAGGLVSTRRAVACVGGSVMGVVLGRSGYPLPCLFQARQIKAGRHVAIHVNDRRLALVVDLCRDFLDISGLVFAVSAELDVRADSSADLPIALAVARLAKPEIQKTQRLMVHQLADGGTFPDHYEYPAGHIPRSLPPACWGELRFDGTVSAARHDSIRREIAADLGCSVIDANHLGDAIRLALDA